MSIQEIHISPELHDRAQTLMLHGIGFVTGDPTIKISNPYVFHPGMQVTVSEPGDSKWIYMMLPINLGSLITNVSIAQHRVGIESKISIIRLIEQKIPISATVIHHYKIHDYKISDNIPSTGSISTGCSVIVKNSILLKVCMDFLNTEDMIEFGSVEIKYIPDYASLAKVNKSDKEKFNGNSDKKNKRQSFTKLLFNKQKRNF